MYGYVIENLINNKLHCEDKPAFIIVENTRDYTMKKSLYYCNNLLHRIDGPASIYYKKFGNNKPVITKNYYYKGRQVYKKN